MSPQHESSVISFSNPQSLEARGELFDLLKNYPATPEESERSLGLFIRASLLSRLFAIQEIYEKIVPLPGVILDVGTWRGQTAVVCENLRAIFEPLHFNRRIICFDTFEGYKGFSSEDKPTPTHRDGTYKVSPRYDEYLSDLLVLHEKNNAMGHNHGKHTVIKGDCLKTIPQFLNEKSSEIIALAFFDLNSVTPTAEAFELIYPRMVPGGIIALWQLTRDSVPAEGMVYTKQILNKCPHQIFRSKYYPGLCYLVKGWILRLTASSCRYEGKKKLGKPVL